MNKIMPTTSTSPLIVAGYVRRSSEMQRDNYSIDAQKRAITNACRLRGLPEPIFYEDDERSARGEQINKRPRFKALLDDARAGRVHIIIVHTFDRWSRNVMVALQSFRTLADCHVAFISLSEHIDYSTPEGRLQLIILAAFAAYFSEMLAKHTSKGKGERAAQGLHNGDVPFGYLWTGAKSPPEHDPNEFLGLRMIGELRMKGLEADKIADALNAEGYRTGSKRFGKRLFTKDTVTAILRNEFYAAYASNDDRGTVKYYDKRYRGLHSAAFTYEEWQQMRTVTKSMHHASTRTGHVRNVYEFAGYVSCIHCGLILRCDTGNTAENRRAYYRDPAKARRIPCSTGGSLMFRIDQVHEQFSKFLMDLSLPENWREEIRRKMIAEALAGGLVPEKREREKERLKLKHSRILRQHREGYIDDEEFQIEIASLKLLLHKLETPEVDSVKYDDVVSAGEHIPEMSTLWRMATPEERREMVVLLLEPGGLYVDLEQKLIAAVKPRSAFLPILRMLSGIVEFDETRGLLLTEHWSKQNREER